MNKISLNYEPLSDHVTDLEISKLKKRFSKKININSVWPHILYVFIFGYVILTVFYSILMLFFSIGSSTGSFILVILIILSIYLLINQHRKLWTKYVRLDKFANLNGMKFIPKTPYPAHQGLIFNIGTENISHERLIGTSLGNFEIANYKYMVGSGRNKRKVDYGYVMIQLSRKLPHIILDSHKNNKKMFGVPISNLPISFKKDQKLALEGDFNSYFDLYVAKNYERDALYIFTPDLMRVFVDHSGSYDAEIVDNRLYIYSDTQFNMTDKIKLKEIFSIINIIGSKIDRRTDRYIDEAVKNNADMNVSEQGRRLKKSPHWLAILIFVLLTLFWVYSFVQ